MSVLEIFQKARKVAGLSRKSQKNNILSIELDYKITPFAFVVLSLWPQEDFIITVTKPCPALPGHT